MALVALAGCGGSSGGSDTTAAPAAVATTSVAPATTATGLAITVPVGVPGELLDGVYRVTITDDDLAAVNVPADAFAQERGTYTYTFKGGEWSYEKDPPTGDAQLEGTYVVDGGNVLFYYRAADASPDPDPFTWNVGDGGALVFHFLPATSGMSAQLGSHPLEKVG